MTPELDTKSALVIWITGIRGGFKEEVGLELAPVILVLSIGAGLQCYSTNKAVSIKNVNEKERNFKCVCFFLKFLSALESQN